MPCNTLKLFANQYKAIIYRIEHDTIQFKTIQYNTIQYNTIQYNTIQYNTNTIQYNTIQHDGNSPPPFFRMKKSACLRSNCLLGKGPHKAQSTIAVPLPSTGDDYESDVSVGSDDESRPLTQSELISRIMKG